MARKSRKNSSKQAAIEVLMPGSLAGVYARLSVEDNNCKTGDSIQNQIAFLKEFVERNEDEFQLVDTYADNGATGINFDREEWERLISDIQAGKINCIIVKDFSRIGRNYIEVGNYMEKIFPFLGVRVVSVNDNFDSQKQSFESNMLVYSLTNIVNEYYARDISKKVVQAKKIMQQNGEYTSGIFPYGYRRSDSDKRRMIPDPEAACVVRKIFEWRTSGKGCTWIANYLNNLAIPSPGMYRYMNGNLGFKMCLKAKWKAEHVSDILKNPVYLGHAVQGKTKISHFKNNGKAQRLPREEWDIVENTHEPLISKSQYEIAEKMARESKRKYIERMNAHADVPHTKNPLSSKIYCGQCGRRMFRRSRVVHGERDYQYYCDARRRLLDAGCTQPYIHEAILMKAIRKAAENQLRMLGKLKHQVHAGKAMGKLQKEEKRKNELEQEMLRIKRQKQEIYEGRKEGMLAKEDFDSERQRLSKRMLQCEEEIRKLEQSGSAEKEAAEALDKLPDNFSELKGEAIPLELLDALIERITIVSPERIEVTFTFADAAAKWHGQEPLLDKGGE